MGRRRVPAEFRHRPFRLCEAEEAGIARGQLRAGGWIRLGPAIYVSKSLAREPSSLLEAARMRLPSTAVFSGLTAAWLHGLDVSIGASVEVTLEDDAGVSGRSGLIVRRAILPPEEVVDMRGFRATRIQRTLADISARLTLTEAVVVADAALHAGHVDLEGLEAWAALHRGRRGIRRLRRVIDMAEPAAESPMESRLRMVIVNGRLPRPAAQVRIYDEFGEFVGRPDLYYEKQRLGIEYDGDVHRSMLAADNRRQNRLLAAGVTLLRFTASDVLSNPSSVVEQVRAELRRSPANGRLAAAELRRSPANAPFDGQRVRRSPAIGGG